MENSGCGCGELGPASTCSADVSGALSIRTLTRTITWRDRLGGWRVRWRMGRDRYRVEPGLYRIGKPDAQSAVLVTANYKLSVDAVRSQLQELDVWLLILDTRGVNVWCAAGKGTFGTTELVRRVESSGLAGIVEHRRLVLPQLGAAGIAAHEVKLATGFSVHYGPVAARDLPAYLAAGLRATPAMRQVTFGWKDRLVVAPVELVGAWKPAVGLLLMLAALELIAQRQITRHIFVDYLPFLGAILTGGVLVPLWLPWLPFRAFALKGAVAGALCALVSILLLPASPIEAVGTTLLAVALTAFMAMTFTGSTTFTNETGTRLEVRRAMPVLVILAVLGIVLRVTAAIV